MLGRNKRRAASAATQALLENLSDNSHASEEESEAQSEGNTSLEIEEKEETVVYQPDSPAKLLRPAPDEEVYFPLDFEDRFRLRFEEAASSTTSKAETDDDIRFYAKIDASKDKEVCVCFLKIKCFVN